MPKRVTLIAVALVALLVLAACGGGEEEAAPPPVATAAAPAAPTVAPTAAPTVAPTEPAPAAAAQPESPLTGAAQPESPLSGAAQGESPLPQPNALTGTGWELTSLNGSPLLPGTFTTVQFNADGTLSGSDGCNRYGASFTLDEGAGTIAVVPGLGTAMACDEPIMQQAAAFNQALAGAAAFALDGDTLTLSDASGAPTLVFAPQRSDLADSNWEAVFYNNGQGGVVSALGEPVITLAFGAEGEVSGFGGCNTFTGSFATPAAGQIAIGPLAATEKACTQPDGLMEQEQRYLAALATVATYTVQGDFLDMRSADGQIAVQAFRTVPAE